MLRKMLVEKQLILREGISSSNSKQEKGGGHRISTSKNVNLHGNPSEPQKGKEHVKTASTNVDQCMHDCFESRSLKKALSQAESVLRGKHDVIFYILTC